VSSGNVPFRGAAYVPTTIGSAADSGPIATGPFVMLKHTPDYALLERNPRHWRGSGARLDRIEFRASLSPTAIAEGLRSGQLDLARDLLPQELETILRDPRFRGGLVETPKKNTYFALFQTASPSVAAASVRLALAGIARTQDFVWGALGRFALPATGLIPPGILGHDPGRRQPHVSKEDALEMVRAARRPSPLRLRASVHPILQNQYAALSQALFRLWNEVGVEVEVVTKTMPAFLEAWHETEGIDVLIGRTQAAARQIEREPVEPQNSLHDLVDFGRSPVSSAGHQQIVGEKSAPHHRFLRTLAAAERQ